MAEPTSWFTVESGWEVQDRAGAVVGEVVEIVGDQDADIFDGLRFEGEDGEQRFVEAGRVGEIVEGTVTIDAEREQLEEGEEEAPEPGGAEITRARDEEI
jgi:hypothetical protein